MKHILLSVIFVNTILFSYAQKAKLEYGFQSGLNISTAYGTSIAKDYRSPLMGLHVGGHIKLNQSQHWGIKFLLSYDQIGWSYNSLVIENNTGSGLLNVDMLIKLNYLNLPMLAEYSFGKKVKIHVNGGPFMGILLNNKIVTKLNEPVPPNEQAKTETSSDYRKKMNVGLSLGSGIQIPLDSKLKLDFNLMNNLGLSNIYKSNTSEVGDIKTNAFTISAGLTFEL
jgi:hypothetical protein